MSYPQDEARPAPMAQQPPLISLAQRQPSTGESPSAIATLWQNFDAQYMQVRFAGYV